MADVKAELTAQMEKMREAFYNKKTDDIINFYTDDCRVIAPHAPIVEGKEALKALFGAMAELLAKVDKIDQKLVDAVSMGDTATSVTTSSSYDKDGNVLDTNRSMTVWKKVNGNWHVHWTIFNSEKPMPAAQ